MSGLTTRQKLEVERAFFRDNPGRAFDEGLLEQLAELEGDVCLPHSNFSVAGRARILNLEREVAKLPQYECPLKHYFVDGLYVREIAIPVGCVLVGYIHMEPCITTISKGRIVIADGQTTKILVAPLTFACAPGSKKAGYALEDTIWSDAYVNTDNERDVDKLEARLTANTHAEFLTRTENRRLT